MCLHFVMINSRTNTDTPLETASAAMNVRDWGNICEKLCDHKIARVTRREFLGRTLSEYLNKQDKVAEPHCSYLAQLIEVFVELNGYYTRADCIEYMQKPGVDARKMMVYLYKLFTQAENSEHFWSRIAHCRTNNMMCALRTKMLLVSISSVLFDVLIKDLVNIVAEYLVNVTDNGSTERECLDVEQSDIDYSQSWDRWLRAFRNPGFTAEDCEYEARLYRRLHPPQPAHRDMDMDSRNKIKVQRPNNRNLRHR